MASTKLHALFSSLICIALLLATSDSVVFGQDLDKHQPISNHVKSFHSLRSTDVEAKRLSDLSDQAELIALGKVRRSHSFWSEDAATIGTESVIVLNRLVKGNAPAEIVVRSEGGFIPDDNIGMVAPHDVSFAVGEEVLIFARKQGDFYRIQNGAAGKIPVDDSLVGDDLSFLGGGPMDWDLLNRLAGASATASHSTSTRRWNAPGTKVGFTVNLNTAQADNDDRAAAFLSAISEAAATWNRTPGADFTLEFAGTTQSTQTGYNHANEIVFMPMGTDNRGALAQVWYNSDFTIVEADIWINDSFDWAAGGELADNELDLQSALVHEFGHWLILNHTDDSTSVMYPTLAPGATRRQLAPRDAEGIAAIYPCLQTACVFDK